mgnify:CR=1 FL=1
MISGPYRSGSDDPAVWAQNLKAMNEAAFEVFKLGHMPVIGVNAALPVIEAAGGEHYNDIMMPLSLALARRCDAVLRTGGPSKGADDEVQVFRDAQKPVFYSITEMKQVMT